MGENVLFANWSAYSDAWSDPSESNRIEVLSGLLNPLCVYTDANIRTVGIEDLSAYMGAFQLNFPGAKFVITDFTFHHEESLTHWNMVDGEGKQIGKGISFGLNEHGKLTKMTGFFL